MQHDLIDRLIHLVSPKAWLAMSLVSLLLAGGASWVLLAQRGMSSKDALFSAYDAVVRFTHETIRLTFKTDRKMASTFVAPIGILNHEANFNWVQSYQDFKPRAEDTPAEPKAPERMLDPSWQPNFSGA